MLQVEYITMLAVGLAFLLLQELTHVLLFAPAPCVVLTLILTLANPGEA